METKELYAVTEKAGTVDERELAHDLLEWARRKEALDVVESRIKQDILLLQESRKVGDVEARYTKPRGRYEWEKAAEGMVSAELTAKHTTTIIKTDWKGLCIEARIEPEYIPGTGPGTVSIRIVS